LAPPLQRLLLTLGVALALPATASAAPYTLVQVRHGSEASAAPTFALLRAERISKTLGVWRLPSATAAQVVPGLRAAGLVRAAGADASYTADDHISHGDPLLPQEWWLAAVHADVAEPPAGPGKPVIVIDAGLDLSHPEFNARPNTTPLNQQVINPRRSDEHHGTAVSSIVGAPANGLGVVGVYPQAALYSYDASPNGQLLSSEIILGLEAASRLCPAVVNLSLGGTERDSILESALHLAVARGCLVVAAAGNEREQGSPIEYPANYTHVLTVGATNQAGGVAEFSNATPNLDLAAPGQDIPVAIPTVFLPTGYSLGDGTSFSAPIVAGAAAWVWTMRPDLDNTQIFEVMRRSARDLGPAGFDPDTGYGLLDITAALAAAPPAADPQEPNDDIPLISSTGLFGMAKAAINSPTRQSTSIAARLDLREDPEDVYRAYLPPHKKLTVTVRPTRDVTLEVWSSNAQTVLDRVGRVPTRLGRSAKPGTSVETVVVSNATAKGKLVYVDASAGADAFSADYTLSVTATALPKPKATAKPKAATTKKR
jgi:hypothetical protein